jgi:hypothetical protein
MYEEQYFYQAVVNYLFPQKQELTNRIISASKGNNEQSGDNLQNRREIFVS